MNWHFQLSKNIESHEIARHEHSRLTMAPLVTQDDYPSSDFERAPLLQNNLVLCAIQGGFDNLTDHNRQRISPVLRQVYLREVRRKGDAISQTFSRKSGFPGSTETRRTGLMRNFHRHSKATGFMYFYLATISTKIGSDTAPTQRSLGKFKGYHMT